MGTETSGTLANQLQKVHFFSKCSSLVGSGGEVDRLFGVSGMKIKAGKNYQ